MKKRLRKKLRLGEFREHCFEVQFQIDPSLTTSAVDELIDSFIEMIERCGLQFGGGGNHEWQGIVQGPWRGTATEADRLSVLGWLQTHPHIVKASAGSLRDAWHGWDEHMTEPNNP